jgi:hypothetical protein
MIHVMGDTKIVTNKQHRERRSTKWFAGSSLNGRPRDEGGTLARLRWFPCEGFHLLIDFFVTPLRRLSTARRYQNNFTHKDHRGAWVLISANSAELR